MPEQPYWIIVSDEGHSTKPKHHTTYNSAFAESVRLSEENPGITFGVFQSIGKAYTPKMTKVTFYKYGELKPPWSEVPQTKFIG